MAEDAKPAKSRGLTSRLVEFCHNPIQLRAVVTVAILGSWYVGFAMPISAEIDDTTARIAREQKRLGLARDVEKLREQVARFDPRLPVKSDPNEWVQYMLDAVRKFPGLKLAMLDTDGTKEVGPYKAMVIKMDVEGSFRETDAFVRWIESNPRLLRLDSIRLEPHRAARGEGPGRVIAQMIILGAMG